eukprot:4704202-Prymnesium_polylepis.1
MPAWPGGYASTADRTSWRASSTDLPLGRWARRCKRVSRTQQGRQRQGTVRGTGAVMQAGQSHPAGARSPGHRVRLTNMTKAEGASQSRPLLARPPGSPLCWS